MADVFGHQDKSRLPSAEREQFQRWNNSPQRGNPLDCLIDANVREEYERKKALFYRAAACFRKSF
jgi:hypothetical protein